jgi:hypothetical protein
MRSKTALAVALMFGSLLGSPIVASPASATEYSTEWFTALVCAPGYHLGPHGNCQPKYNPGRRCQHGFTSEPFPNGRGYRCVPKV